MNEAHMKRLREEVARLDKKYGHKTGGLGSDDHPLNVIPTGILSLDYALGTGGWPLGHPIEIYGPPDIGKSSVLGLSAIKEAQKEDKGCGIIALEPGFDKDWAAKNGVNVDEVIIARPDTGEEAFDILFDWIKEPLIDFILFDSIGAMLKASEVKDDGKMSMAGQAGLITWGMKRILIPAWKNNKGVMFLNQIRDDMSSPYAGQYDSPGGWAAKHGAAIRIQLRPGKEKYKVKEGEGDARHDVIVGRQLVAVVKRNKLTEGSEQRAVFDYWQKETEDHSIGIDLASDVKNMAVRTGVIRKAGGWYYHDSFPEGKLQGVPAIQGFIEDKPEVVKTIRDEVLEEMVKQKGAPKNLKPDEQETTSQAA